MSVTRIARPPKDLNSFEGRKWLESLINQNADFGAISDLEFLLLDLSGTTPNARKLVGSSHISIADGGAGGVATLNLADTGVVAGTYTKVTVNAKGTATSGAAATTSDISEGANLYFTNARVLAALPQAIGTTDSPTFNGLSLSSLGVKAGGSSGYIAKVGGVIFDHYADAGNVGTGEDDLYSDTLPADTLSANGQKIVAEYGLTIVASGTATRQVKAYFGGTLVLDSGALTFASGGTAQIWITIIRETSSVVRVMAEFVPSGITLQPIVTYTRITGLTLSNTQILKITGEAAGVGAATNDVVAKLGVVEWKAAA